jgi:adenine phosphoribosyltransferase
MLITHLVHHILTTHESRPDVIVGLDARGFLLGPVIAMRLGAAFVPVRKGGKLPGEVQVVTYEKEYGADEFEMQAGAVKPGQKCIVIEWVDTPEPR